MTRKPATVTPIDNTPIPTPEDPPAPQTLEDTIHAFANTLRDLRRTYQLSEGGAIRLVEIVLQFHTNSRALGLQEMSQQGPPPGARSLTPEELAAYEAATTPTDPDKE